MLKVTAAVTPKGERRRYALVSAAADLLCEGGFDAVRHRSVARRAIAVHHHVVGKHRHADAA